MIHQFELMREIMNRLQVLQQIVKGNIELINDFNQDLSVYLDDEIVIKPSYVRNMLNRFLNKSVNIDDIKEWARFICGRGEYIVPGNDDKTTDFYEDMYYVIQRLSTPEIDGEINEERVKGYLKELEKYPNDPS